MELGLPGQLDYFFFFFLLLLFTLSFPGFLCMYMQFCILGAYAFLTTQVLLALYKTVS